MQIAANVRPAWCAGLAPLFVLACAARHARAQDLPPPDSVAAVCRNAGAGLGLHSPGLAWSAGAGLLGILLWLLLASHRRTERLYRESHTDAMTGLLNRRGYEAAVHRAMHRARVTCTPVALLVMDLDDFKRANDEHGHLAGDAVLRAVGAALLDAVPRGGTVCRYAGDEFVILLPRVEGGKAMQTAEHIVGRLKSVAVATGSGALEIPLGASVGVAVFDGEEEIDAETLFRAADAALYQSKREGKGQARFALRVAS